MKKISKTLRFNLTGLVIILLLSSAAAVKYFDVSKNLEIFTSAYKELNLYYVDETNPGDLMKTGLDAMFGSLDPYTIYYTESKIEDARFKYSGQYGGVGIFLENQDGKVVVSEVLEGYPAEKAGIREGDEIILIDDKKVKSFDQEQLDAILKGNVGSEIILTFTRQDEVKVEALTRAEIQIKEVPYSGMISENTGYIKLTSFTKTSSSSVRAALRGLQATGKLERLVLDLRGNGGGLLREAVNIVNLFVPKGELVVSTKGKIDSWNKVYETKQQPMAPDVPLAILINGRSASASEIVSGALQDLDRAVVIGERSFGKGLVQQTKDLVYNARMKLTIAKYYIPSGRCIQKLDYSNRVDGEVNEMEDSVPFKTRNGRTVFDGRGVDPDVEVKAEQVSELFNSLKENQVLFDYVSSYINNSDKPDTVLNFKYTDQDYEEFKTFVKSRNFNYSTLSESKFEELMKTAKDENYFNSSKSQFEQLEKSLSPSLESDLERFKTQIKAELQSMIARRYFFRSGQIQFNLMEDPLMLKCEEVFSSNYSSILGN